MTRKDALVEKSTHAKTRHSKTTKENTMHRQTEHYHFLIMAYDNPKRSVNTGNLCSTFPQMPNDETGIVQNIQRTLVKLYFVFSSHASFDIDLVNGRSMANAKQSFVPGINFVLLGKQMVCNKNC